MADDTPGRAGSDGGTAPEPGPAPTGPPPGFAGGTPTPPPGFAGSGSGASTPGGPPRGFAGANPDVADPYASTPYAQVPAPPTRSSPPPKKGKGGVIALLVVIVALAAGGIWFAASSGDDDSASSSEVAEGGPGATVEAYWQALKDSDWERACSAMSKELQAQASASSDGASCADAIAQAAEGEAPPGDVKVLDEEVTGARAVVKVEQDGNESDYDLTREGGAWRITIRGTSGTGGATTTVAPSNAPNDDIDAASAAACDANFRVAQTAAQAYLAETGTTATSWDVLVPDYIRSVPSGFELVDGQVIRTPGGPCA